MKRTFCWMAAGLGLAALLSNGCVLTSAQILVHYDLWNPVTIVANTDWGRLAVDLNTEDDYAKHKDKLKGLTDLAILGKFTNLSGPAGNVTVYIDAGTTTRTTLADITTNSTMLWGPVSIGASGTTAATLDIGWNDSAKLFNAAGRKILINQVKGTGLLTLYMVGSTGTYQIKIERGKLILVIEGGV